MSKKYSAYKSAVTGKFITYKVAVNRNEKIIGYSKDFKIKGQQNYSRYVKGGVLVETEKIRGNLNEIGYEIYKCPVVVQRARIMRVRPLFKDWKLEFDISIIDPQISPDQLKEFIEAGGKYNGLGDSRPEFGRFEIEKFDVVK